MDDVCNHFRGFLGEKKVVDSQRVIEPLDLVLDHVIRNEALLVDQVQDGLALGVLAWEIEVVVVGNRRDRERRDVRHL